MLRSFSGDTEVLLANGQTIDIADVQVGDLVFAHDPETGVSGPRAVTATWPHTDTLVEFEVGSATVTTTEDHEFWNVTDQAWQETQHIDEGDLLLTAGGLTVEAGTLLWDTAHVAPAFDLTIDGIHTYHVTFGDESVLVHNNDGPCQEVLDRAAELGVDPEYLDELARDPASGGTVDADSLREAEVGVLLDQRGDLPGPLRRDASGAGEFFDANGELWDIKAFRSTRPDGSPNFVLEAALSSIQGEFLAGENIILDTLNLDEADLSALLSAIAESDFEPKLSVVVL